jgi:hypothetical protein
MQLGEKNLCFNFFGTTQDAILLGQSDPAPMIAQVWDELKFIPIIGFVASIEVGSFFFPSLISRLPIKKIYSTTQAFQISNPNYLPPPHRNPKPHHHSRAKMVLKRCCRRQCCKGCVEVML